MSLVRSHRPPLAAVAACAVVALVAVAGAAPAGHGRLRAGDLAAAAAPARFSAAVPPLPRLRSRGLPARVRLEAATRRAARMPYVVRGGGGAHEVALTFDDGPGPYTWAVVRVLRRLHAPATFFQVGEMVRAFPRAARAEARDPSFAVGDHTESHADLTGLSRAGQRAQIAGEEGAARAAGLPRPRLFRPPYGAFDATTRAIARRLGLVVVVWSVDSEDWTRPGPGAIARRVLADAQPGAIVLMHDAGGDRSQTVRALPRIIRGLRARHLRLVTVPRLLADAPPPRRQRLPGLAGPG